MFDFEDVCCLFINILKLFKNSSISLFTPLDEIILLAVKDKIAYLDNRKDAQDKYRFDFWKRIKGSFKSSEEFIDKLKSEGISKNVLYSKSDQFPDIVFNTKILNTRLINGSLLELKDSKSDTISSFNSTLPTKQKNLKKIEKLNGNNLITKIVRIFDPNCSHPDFETYERKCFYFIRTGLRDSSKIKISLVDGSFFETIPSEKLINETILSILKKHVEAGLVSYTESDWDKLNALLEPINNQNLIASSKNIDKASVKPRIRLMAEVHREGNPHSAVYPEIASGTFNFIVSDKHENEVGVFFEEKEADLEKFKITHKRNGKYMVFQHAFGK